MASPCLLGWAVSEVTCRDTVRLPPGMFTQLAPTCTSYVIPHTSKHSQLTRHERKKRKKERCAHIPGFHKSQIIRLQESPAKFRRFSPKAPGWECGTLGLESEAVSEPCGFPVSQPFALRQRRESGWRVCNTDHTGSRGSTSAPAESLPSLSA